MQPLLPLHHNHHPCLLLLLTLMPALQSLEGATACKLSCVPTHPAHTPTSAQPQPQPTHALPQSLEGAIWGLQESQSEGMRRMNSGLTAALSDAEMTLQVKLPLVFRSLVGLLCWVQRADGGTHRRRDDAAGAVERLVCLFVCLFVY